MYPQKTTVYGLREYKMEGIPQTNNLGIADRLTRSKGRSSRNRMANARVTQDEQRELEQAAKAEDRKSVV